MAKQPKSGSKAKRRKKKPPAPSGPSGPPTSFEVPYGSPGALVVGGPIVKAWFTLPLALEQALRARGEAIPPPIHGVMLVDTGATLTAIAQDVAVDLGLPVVDQHEGYGAGGKHRNNVYPARLNIAISGNGGQTYTIHYESAVQGIPELGNYFKNFPAAPRMIGLMGRDLLAHCKVTYDGPKGLVRYEFDHLSIARASSPPQP